MALRHCIKDIIFVDPVQMRGEHGHIMNEVRYEA